MSFAFRLLPAIPIAALLLAGTARAESKASAVIGVEGGYGSNPLLSGGQDEQSGSVILSAAPTVSLIGPTSHVDLNGRVEQAFFTSRNSDYTNWSLGANAGVKLSPLSELSVQAGYTSRVSSGINSVVSLPTEDGTIPPPDPSETEIAGQRSESLTASGTFSSRLSTRDTLSLGANVYKTDYPASFNSSNTTYGGSVAISHVFNSKLSAGLSLDYSRTDYEQSTFGTSERYAPTANATISLAPRMLLTVSAGASFGKSSGTTIPSSASSSTKAYFSGSANLCRQGTRSNLCVFASRSVGPAAQAGTSTINQFGGNYSYTLTPRSSFNLGANYSQTKSIDLGTSNDYSYANAYAGYSHQLTQRLSFVVNARYTNPIKSIGTRGQSFYGGAGVTYRLGR